MKIQARRKQLFNAAIEMNIQIINAKSTKDNNRVAIHLLNPDLNDLEDALEVASRDMFPAIVIHNNSTFGRN